ncbi:MAG TPA: MraY family glycosyltransferase [Symbiobacteriaceae bacterium]|nr:MraY family glycosyltransferase [Symbiobacteriaceae bacterium]
MLWPSSLLAFGLAIVLSLVLTPVARRIALRVDMVDRPVNRSMHSEPKPYLGGVAIYLAFMITALISGGRHDPKVIGLVLTGGLMVALGVVDDKLRLKARTKFLGQILIAALLVYGWQMQITFMWNPLNSSWLNFGWLAGPLSVIWIVAMVNVVNLVDGLDGLAAGISTIAALTLMLIALQQGMSTPVILTAALAGSTIGFLRYNFNPAKIFMGDAGSMFLGFALAGLSIQGVMKSALAVGVVVPVLALGLPILDTAFAIIRRLATGRSIGEADKDHLHHRLLRLGLSHRNTVLVMWAISAWMGLTAVALVGVRYRYAILIVAVLAVVVLFGARRLGLLRLNRDKETAER